MLIDSRIQIGTLNTRSLGDKEAATGGCEL